MFRFGSGIRLFEIFGITVYLHPSWFILAIYAYTERVHMYRSPVWAALEILALFAIVLMHEFGHALACRSVGGTANRIMLWPLGGVAFVNPPRRPGAQLWSIAAGPLVNVALFVLTLPLWTMHIAGGPDVRMFVRTLLDINLVLLIFNMLPVYPLDGGQILWSLLWFPLGFARSLMVAASIGFVAAVAGGIWALLVQDYLLALIGAFVVYQSVTGFRYALSIHRRDTAPRRAGAACPYCHQPPPMGAFWTCRNCNASFDAFDYPVACPGCGAPHSALACMNCGRRSEIAQWERGTQMRVTAHDLEGVTRDEG